MLIGVSSGRYDIVPMNKMFVVDTDDFIIESEDISVLASSNLEIICDTVQENLVKGYRGISASFWGSPRVVFPGVGLYKTTIKINRFAPDFVKASLILLLNGEPTTLFMLDLLYPKDTLPENFNLTDEVYITPYYFCRVGDYFMQLVNVAMSDMRLLFKLIWSSEGTFLGCYRIRYTYRDKNRPPKIFAPLRPGLQSRLEMLIPF